MSAKKNMVGLVIDAPITAYIKASSTNEMEGGPSWASFVVNQQMSKVAAYVPRTSQ